MRACVQTTIASGGGGALSSSPRPGLYIILFANASVGKGGGGGGGGGGGRGGGDSVRALSKYLGRDTTYTMIMWAGLVRYLRGGAASGLAELESRLDRSGV